MQVLNFQTLAFFFFLFAPRLHHRIGCFRAEVPTFSHPIHKNRPFRGQQLIFADPVHKNGHFYGQQTPLQLVFISGDGDITVVIHSNSTSNHNRERRVQFRAFLGTTVGKNDLFQRFRGASCPILSIFWHNGRHRRFQRASLYHLKRVFSR